ncbi:alpha/beta hydrolase [Candidatus Laterigemmans baculatus]|uniref:alpha/beta hydrolase n=1 Tax=Candidatus Laterigemmans baculatus TaxID=2770505 RepID=UPI0013D9E52F|nr:alpha/beta hydrolase [Candidatus Laterigemmans baculatus]
MPWSQGSLALSLALAALVGISSPAVAEEALPATRDTSAEETPPQRPLVVDADVEFARPDGEPLHCDIYRPAAPEESSARAIPSAERQADAVPKRPAVLLVHGGGWASGDKWTTAGYARAFAEAGMVAVTINYRHAPTHKFPAQVDDVRAALAWIGQNAETYGIDTNRVGMFGYSAGAHLVCMIGTLSDAEWADVAPTTRWEADDPRWKAIPRICAIVGGGAPCEFRTLPIDNTAISYFLGGTRRELPEIYRAASPAAHASSGDVPVLFVHGTSDLIVPEASSRILYEAQLACGVTSEYLALDGAGHMLAYLNPATRQAALQFLTTRLGLKP